MVDPGFSLRRDDNGSTKWPDGYWYAVTSDGNYDAVGSTVEVTLARLIKHLHEALLEASETLKKIQPKIGCNNCDITHIYDAHCLAKVDHS